MNRISFQQIIEKCLLTLSFAAISIFYSCTSSTKGDETRLPEPYPQSEGYEHSDSLGYALVKDKAGRLVSIKKENQQIFARTYSQAGKITFHKYYEGDVLYEKSYQYDHEGLLNSLRLYKKLPGQPEIDYEIQFEYDSANNIIAETYWSQMSDYRNRYERLDSTILLTYNKQGKLINRQKQIEEVIDTVVDSANFVAEQKPQSTESSNIIEGSFDNDNISLEKVSQLVADYKAKKNITDYSQYSNHTYHLKRNAPSIDWERPLVKVGNIGRKYFQNSNDVAMQIDFDKKLRIDFHPNGSIYVVRGKDKIGYVYLDNHIIMVGEVRDIKGKDYPIGIWKTPSFSYFNMDDRAMVNKYPGAADEVFLLVNYYAMSADDRSSY